MSDGLLTIREAAAFLCVSRSTLYGRMDAGELAFVKLGRSRRIPRRALIDLAASGLQGAGGPEHGLGALAGESAAPPKTPPA